MTYEELLQEAEDNGFIVKEKPLKGHNGRIKGNRIAIKQDMLTTEKAGTLAEELGHYKTAVGNILDERNAKQELQGRLWAYNKQIGLAGIAQAFENRCQSIEEMADYLNVTEKFLLEAIKCYKQKYGLYAEMDNYIIQFEPSLQVIKLL